MMRPNMPYPHYPPPQHGQYTRPPVGMDPNMRPQMKAAPPASAIRRRPESEYMDADEIETILRIQWKSLHNGPAYIEDYYYQVGGRSCGRHM